jgi:hypothetical protein
VRGAAPSSRTRRRIVFLGASNLTVGLGTVLATARARLGPEPVEVFVAAGHGRAYGRWSRVAIRGLPAIVDCGLWRALDRGTAPATYALVTDIGNDLAYGATAAELAGWVGTCVERLAALGADRRGRRAAARSAQRDPPGRHAPVPLLTRGVA